MEREKWSQSTLGAVLDCVHLGKGEMSAQVWSRDMSTKNKKIFSFSSLGFEGSRSSLAVVEPITGLFLKMAEDK